MQRDPFAMDQSPFTKYKKDQCTKAVRKECTASSQYTKESTHHSPTTIRHSPKKNVDGLAGSLGRATDVYGYARMNVRNRRAAEGAEECGSQARMVCTASSQ